MEKNTLPNASEKHFPEWMNIKEELHNSNKRRSVTEGQIWWAAIGENVGVEINGKSSKFSRPVLIFKKLSSACFLGVPLTSQEHKGSWYVPFEFQHKIDYAVLSQIRILSVSRLYGEKCIGKISKSDFDAVQTGFMELYS